MYHKTVVRCLLLWMCCELCSGIKVPIVWNDDSESSEVTDGSGSPSEDKAESLQAEDDKDPETPVYRKPIPVEYFQYTAKKPQFASDIASFHGMQSPNEHYKSYPVRPYTELEKPDLGKHHLYDKGYSIYEPLQKYTAEENRETIVHPVSNSYEVYHPYKAEEPALQELYKDPILDKIRNDLRESKERLKQYESDGGGSAVTKDEYLESPEETDRKKFPQRNVPAAFEIHRPQRRPLYYRMPIKFNPRHQHLNQRFRHPLNYNHVKIKPVHYRPLYKHINNLRQHHAIKYDDEQNEYPHEVPKENYAEPYQDGYDIYEKGKANYVRLRDNVDEAINSAVKKNRPIVSQKLELQDNGKVNRYTSKDSDDSDEDEDDDEREEFVPVKSYAQVRKTERMMHLPKQAAYDDANNFEEQKNAPRLKEAVKSTKAQTVYTEEGYEDSAYDHAGEQKHASDHEGHGGYLKEKEISEGKYKIPSLSAAYEDARNNIYGDKTMHGEKWKNIDKDTEKDAESEDYSEDDDETEIDADAYEDKDRPKREKTAENDEVEKLSEEENDEENSYGGKKLNKREQTKSKDEDYVDDEEIVLNDNQHDVNKREVNFKVPVINFNDTYLTEKDILQIAKDKIVQPKKDTIKDKYPYYFKNFENISRHSPLRYAEDLKLIPKKSKGGTEFYDSRPLVCPEVEDDVDPIPEKIKINQTKSDNNEPDENSSRKKRQADFNQSKETPRLKGLGDKIDCFKAKYFGDNPLDSPFFKEDIISGPEPLIIPDIPILKLNKMNEPLIQESKFNNVFSLQEKLREENKKDIFILFDKLKQEQSKLEPTILQSNIPVTFAQNESLSNNTGIQQQNVYKDVLDNIRSYIQKPIFNDKINVNLLNTEDVYTLNDQKNVTYNVFQNQDDVTKPPVVRKKRAAPFVYEPYKIIKDSQVLDSKKTTTTSNIGPLIRQLQLSNIVDKVSSKVGSENVQLVKRNVTPKHYKVIDRSERNKNTEPVEDFVDVNNDGRRGEPRYEMKMSNHKSEYKPVVNKKSMSLEEYQALINTDDTKSSAMEETYTTNNLRTSKPTKPTNQPYFDVSKFLPKPVDHHKSAASQTVRRIIRTTTPSVEQNNKKTSLQKPQQEEDESEEYEEYEDEEEQMVSTTTTTTTVKPAFKRRRVRVTTSTTSTTTSTTRTPTTTEEIIEEEYKKPKLRLVTRFRQPPPEEQIADKEKEKQSIKKETQEPPKYREKSKKTSKSTLVTDTKSYGDDDDDMRKEEVDALIGVHSDMDDYVPRYEKEMERKYHKAEREDINKPVEETINNQKKHEPDEEDYDSEEDSDESEEADDDENDENEDDVDEEEEREEEEESEEPVVINTEPHKRTTVRTTEATPSTTEAKSSKIVLQPIVKKKKIEIHKELPVNRSSPHVTQFKQDIKEVEVIKELPRRKSQKNAEALELYKDDKLAEEVNKLGHVEIFKQNLDLKHSPRHGGNYRSAQDFVVKVSSTTQKPQRGRNILKEDAETSQSTNRKLVEVDKTPSDRRNGGNLKGESRENAKLVEISDSSEEDSAEHTTPLHGGNLKSYKDFNRRGEQKNAKIIELDDQEEEDSAEIADGGYASNDRTRNNGRNLHGGNYRGAKLFQASSNNDESSSHENIRAKSEKSKDFRNNAASLLDSFAKAVPILTTAPPFILDPSKRMYYFVDA